MCILDVEHKPVAPWLVQLIDELRAHTHTPIHSPTHTHTHIRTQIRRCLCSWSWIWSWKLKDGRTSIMAAKEAHVCACPFRDHSCVCVLPLMLVKSKNWMWISIEYSHRTRTAKCFNYLMITTVGNKLWIIVFINQALIFRHGAYKPNVHTYDCICVSVCMYIHSSRFWAAGFRVKIFNLLLL